MDTSLVLVEWRFTEEGGGVKGRHIGMSNPLVINVNNRIIHQWWGVGKRYQQCMLKYTLSNC